MSKHPLRSKLNKLYKELEGSRLCIQDEVNTFIQIRCLTDRLRRRNRDDANYEYTAMIRVLIERNLRSRLESAYLSSVVELLVGMLPEENRAKFEEQVDRIKLSQLTPWISDQRPLNPGEYSEESSTAQVGETTKLP